MIEILKAISAFSRRVIPRGWSRVLGDPDRLRLARMKRLDEKRLRDAGVSKREAIREASARYGHTPNTGENPNE